MRLRVHGYRFDEIEVGKPLLGMHERRADAGMSKASERQAEGIPAHTNVSPTAAAAALMPTIRTQESQSLVRCACMHLLLLDVLLAHVLKRSVTIASDGCAFNSLFLSIIPYA
jgi:hypothetical protein